MIGLVGGPEHRGESGHRSTSWRLAVPSVARGSVRVRYRWSWGSPFTTSAARGSAVRRVRVRLGNNRVEQHPRTANCVHRRHRRNDVLPVADRTTNPNPNHGAREDYCVVERSWTRLRRLFALFCHAAFSFTSSQGRHRHRSVCGDTEAVAAASRRIRAALRRGARILIAYSVLAVARVKAINSST